MGTYPEGERHNCLLPLWVLASWLQPESSQTLVSPTNPWKGGQGQRHYCTEMCPLWAPPRSWMCWQGKPVQSWALPSIVASEYLQNRALPEECGVTMLSRGHSKVICHRPAVDALRACSSWGQVYHFVSSPQSRKPLKWNLHFRP